MSILFTNFLMMPLRSLWSVVRPHLGAIIVSVVITGACASLFYRLIQRHDDSVVQEMRTLDKLQQDRLKKLQDAHDAEMRASEQNCRRLEEKLQMTKEEYDRRIKDLEERKVAQVIKLVNQFSSDPSGMVDVLAKLTGMQVYTVGSK